MLTLGDLLYEGATETLVSEQEWVGLMSAIAARDRRALHALYERTHRIVFTLAVRITNDRERADQTVVDVFHDVWRRAWTYDAAEGAVVGWVLKLSRARALDGVRFEQRQGSVQRHGVGEAGEPLDVRELARRLNAALTLLTHQERQTIEMAFFAELADRDVAERIDLPLAIVKARIASGLLKLQQVLGGLRGDPSIAEPHRAAHREQLSVHALGALPDAEAAAIQRHVDVCPDCQRELAALRLTVESFVAWPIDILRPPAAHWDRIAERITTDTATGSLLDGPPPPPRGAFEWKNVAPGISCTLLATDPVQRRVSLLVSLAPGAKYPSHRHAGVEELYMLEGELMVDGYMFHPGDYRHGQPGTTDHRVWSPTGCTGLLVTSIHDTLLEAH